MDEQAESNSKACGPDSRLECHPEYRIVWLRFVVLLFSVSREMPEYCQENILECFFPHSVQFLIHSYLIIRRYIALVTVSIIR
jgi:hypothetical protein